MLVLLPNEYAYLALVALWHKVSMDLSLDGPEILRSQQTTISIAVASPNPHPLCTDLQQLIFDDRSRNMPSLFFHTANKAYSVLYSI